MSSTMDAQAIKQMPPSLLQTLPAGSPPPGIQPNFEDPPTLVPALLGVGAAFLALAVFCFSIRAWTKLTINKKFSWDDRTYSKCCVRLSELLECSANRFLPVTCSLGFVGVCTLKRKTRTAPDYSLNCLLALCIGDVCWHSTRLEALLHLIPSTSSSSQVVTRVC